MIKVYSNGVKVTITEFIFSGGEVHINFLSQLAQNAEIQIEAQITSSDELMKLVMINESLSQFDLKSKVLKMGYIPYARQDRRCVKGDAFSLKAFCVILNSLKFDKVIVVDPHSDVSTALIDNVVVITQLDVIKSDAITQDLMYNTIAVSPDAGANKKTFGIAQQAGKSFIRADKIRDVCDGHILDTVVYCDDLEGADVTIWDDICDGGRTFIELIKKLKEKNVGKVTLFVTHGIFSKGYEPLFESGVDQIITTNTFSPEPFDNVTIIDEWEPLNLF